MASPFELEQPLPTKPKVASLIATANNPTAPPETKHKAEMEVHCVGDQG